MRERPIIFNGEMVRAVMEGRKTQTRRIMKVQPHAGVRNSVFVKSGFEDGHGQELVCPFGAVGDRLWVRETWSLLGNEDGCAVDWNDNIVFDQKSAARIYRASCFQKPNNYGPWSIPDHDFEFEGRWKPSIHMPRWASRITLEITDVRVERLQDISDDDALAEGFDPSEYKEAIAMGWNEKPSQSFKRGWRRICGEVSWQANPWVWVIEFKRVEGE